MLFYSSSAFVTGLVAWNIFACWRKR